MSQTDGPDLPEAATKLEGVAPDGQFQSLADVATSFGFTVEKVEDKVLGGANGDCDPTAKKIRVKASNSGQQQVKTLAHELGHAILHDSDSDLPRDHKEIEAESVAYVVSKILGIDSSDYSFGYLASWSKGDPDEAEKTIKASGMRIQKASHQIIEAFEGDEPAVEVSNELGIEMQPPEPTPYDPQQGTRERGRDLDLRQRHSDPQLEGSTESELDDVLVNGPGVSEVSTVDLSFDDEQVNKYRPLSSDELEVLDAPTLGGIEVEFGR
ncbi:MAG: ImmA/IrrE family metallo-endopeptidase [Acidimicrobiales bacterium]